MKYIIFWLNNAATAHDKTAIKNRLKIALADSALISLDSLPEYKNAVGTVTGRLLVADLAQIKHRMAQTVTREQFETWKTANLNNPNHFQIRVVTNWQEAVTDLGFTKIESNE